MGKKGIIPWNFDDLTGRRFGRLTVVQKVSKKSSETEIQRLKDNWKGEL